VVHSGCIRRNPRDGSHNGQNARPRQGRIATDHLIKACSPKLATHSHIKGKIICGGNVMFDCLKYDEYVPIGANSDVGQRNFDETNRI
jgi:hypothetical protein